MVNPGEMGLGSDGRRERVLSGGFLPGRGSDLRELNEALSNLFGVPVRTHELRRGISAIDEASSLAESPEEPEVGVHIAVQGQFTGRLLLLMHPADARRIGRLLGEGDAPSEEVLDACREVGMIIAGHYLWAVEQFAGEMGVPTPPASAVDMLAAIVQSVLANAGDGAVASLYRIDIDDPLGAVQMKLLVLRDAPAHV